MFFSSFSPGENRDLNYYNAGKGGSHDPGFGRLAVCASITVKRSGRLCLLIAPGHQVVHCRTFFFFTGEFWFSVPPPAFFVVCHSRCHISG